jgi:hypothetical protein
MLFLFRAMDWGQRFASVDISPVQTLLHLCGLLTQDTDCFDIIHGDDVRRMRIKDDGEYSLQARSCSMMRMACESILTSIHTTLADLTHPLFTTHMPAVAAHAPRAIEYVVVGPGAGGQRWHGDTPVVLDWHLCNFNIFIMLSDDSYESTRMLRPGTSNEYTSFICKQGDLWVCPSDDIHAGAPNTTTTDRVVLFISYGENSTENVHFANAPFNHH